MRCMEIDRFGGSYALLIYLACACGSFWCNFLCVEDAIKKKCPPRDESAGICLLNKAAGFSWNLAQDDSTGKEAVDQKIRSRRVHHDFKSAEKILLHRTCEPTGIPEKCPREEIHGNKAVAHTMHQHTIPRSHTILRRSNLLPLSFYFKVDILCLA